MRQRGAGEEVVERGAVGRQGGREEVGGVGGQGEVEEEVRCGRVSLDGEGGSGPWE